MPNLTFVLDQMYRRCGFKLLDQNRLLLHEASGLEATFYDNEGIYTCDLGFSWDTEEAFESDPSATVRGALIDALLRMRQEGEVFRRLSDSIDEVVLG